MQRNTIAWNRLSKMTESTVNDERERYADSSDENQLITAKKRLSRINGLVNDMAIQQVVDKLKELELSTK